MAGVYMAGDFRNGTTFEMDGGVFRVVEFQHVKPGKGAAFVRTKLKNVITGAVLEKTFNPSDKYPGAEIEKKTMQYLYNDGDLYYFMDNETYDQMPLNKADIGDCLKYLKENIKKVEKEKNYEYFTYIFCLTNCCYYYFNCSAKNFKVSSFSSSYYICYFSNCDFCC